MNVSKSSSTARLPAWCRLHFLAVLGVGCAARAAPPRPVRAEVVFVCEHGAAKSVVAAAYLNRLAADRGLDVRAVARGADPQAQPSTSASEGLRSDGLAPSAEPPRPLTAMDVRSSARVVAFDCDQAAMTALRGIATCWNDVPATGADYARARDAIRAHVAALLDELAGGVSRAP